MDENVDEKPEPMGNLVPQSVDEEMSTSYINYAMSVIIGRELPDVRDVLKTIHKRTEVNVALCFKLFFSLSETIF